MEEKHPSEFNNDINNTHTEEEGNIRKEDTPHVMRHAAPMSSEDEVQNTPISAEPNFTMVNQDTQTSEQAESVIEQSNIDRQEKEGTSEADFLHGEPQQAEPVQANMSCGNDAQKDSGSMKEPEIKTAKEPFTKRYRTALLLGGCLLIGGIGGFGGSYLSSRANGSGQTVLYQSVEQKDSDGNTITNMSVKDIVANTANSVVEITTESAATDSYFQQMVTTGAGSGVIISKDGYIVTNNHVVDGANKITVRTKDGTEYTAKLIGVDAKTDLAVIKIEASNLNAAIMGTSSSLSVGDEAIAIGNPLGELGGTVTRGIISALDREITIDGQSMTLLQTDTAINKGNSGGGLFNSNGELIGIVNAKSSGTSVEGLGFAIPIDTAKPVIESLISSGYVTGRPQLGVSMVNVTDDQTAFQAGVNELGVYIAKVNDGSSAQEAGLQVKDRVISVDGQEIASSSDIAKIVDSKKVGDTITLVLERDGKQVTATATLKEAEQTVSNSNNNNSQIPNQGSSQGNGFNSKGY